MTGPPHRWCSVEGCGRDHHGNGLCAAHYRRWRKGDVAQDRPLGLRTVKPEERFWSKVDKSAECWLWTSRIDRYGYARLTTGTGATKRSALAHRFAYELLVGAIPEGLTLDHLCRNRACVNPAHLEPVTVRDNVLRSPVGPSAVNARKTHCPKGHPYDEENTYMAPSRYAQHRQCRECKRLQGKHRVTLRAAAASLLLVFTSLAMPVPTLAATHSACTYRGAGPVYIDHIQPGPGEEGSRTILGGAGSIGGCPLVTTTTAESVTITVALQHSDGITWTDQVSATYTRGWNKYSRFARQAGGTLYALCVPGQWRVRVTGGDGFAPTEWTSTPWVSYDCREVKGAD